MEDDGQIVDRFDLVDELDEESAAAVIFWIFVPCVFPSNRLCIEWRSIVKIYTGSKLEYPRLVVVGMGPGYSELRHDVAVVIAGRQCIKDQCCRHLRCGIEDADLHRIEARNVKLGAHRNAAAPFLCSSRSRRHQ